MSEGEKVKPGELRGVTLDSIRNECLDAPGYVIFAGVISNERDAQGNNLINFRYIREKFSYDDTKTAVDQFKAALVRDVRDGEE